MCIYVWIVSLPLSLFLCLSEEEKKKKKEIVKYFLSNLKRFWL